MRYDLVFGILIPSIWLVWLIYWWYSARDVKQTTVGEPLGPMLQHRIPIVLAVVFLSGPRLVPRLLTSRFLPVTPLYPALGTALLVLGLGLAVWARRHLGRNWSYQVVVKRDHALVRTGPYRSVRHPIYTGILLALAGMVLTIGEWRAIIGLALAVLSLVIKSRHEEARMRQTFPEYARYQRETAALVPYLY
jgi:protein-S-isoprenylcysteine O-methyltransferase Ste14